jgi:hypothetical protein
MFGTPPNYLIAGISVAIDSEISGAAKRIFEKVCQIISIKKQGAYFGDALPRTGYFSVCSWLRVLMKPRSSIFGSYVI